jgi:hypothetical protein
MHRFVILFLVGCAAGPADAVFEPDRVVTGIYTLHDTSITDTCTPARYNGTATVALFSTNGVLQFADVNDGAEAEMHELAASDGYSERIPHDGTRLDPCPPSSDGTVVFSYTLEDASDHHVDIAAEETWILSATCQTSTVNASVVPTASCAAARTLSYELVSACAAPCTITGSLSELTCTCT